MKLSYSDQYIKLGLNIAYYRKLRGYTQEQLSEKLGIDRTHIGRIETANVGASLDVMFAVAEALAVPINKLFEFRD